METVQPNCLGGRTTAHATTQNHSIVAGVTSPTGESRMIDAYILRSSSGKTVLVIESEDDYYIRRVVRRLQKLREKDLKEVFFDLERYMDTHPKEHE